LSDGTNNATTNTQTSNYTKIGNVVKINCRITTSSLGSVTGAIRITGLPFAANGGYTHALTVGGAFGLAITAGQAPSAYIPSGQAYVQLNMWDDVAGHTTMQATEWTADGQMIISGTYTV